MSWENRNVIEGKVEAYFKHREPSYTMLFDLIKFYNGAKQKVDRTSLITSKASCSTRQKINHTCNCEDMEYKRMLVQYCINELSDYKEGLTIES